MTTSTEPHAEGNMAAETRRGRFAVVSRCSFKRLTQEEWKASSQCAFSSVFQIIATKGRIENLQLQLEERSNSTEE
jgi:hypothetical protein